MIFSNYYWYYKSVLTPKFCDDVIKHGLNKTEVVARTGGYGEKEVLSKDQVQKMKRKRNSSITWLDDSWIYKEIHP